MSFDQKPKKAGPAGSQESDAEGGEVDARGELVTKAYTGPDQEAEKAVAGGGVAWSSVILFLVACAIGGLGAAMWPHYFGG